MIDPTGSDLLGMCERLKHYAPDELAVVDYVMRRLEKGRVDYGPLHLDGDERDWNEQSCEELGDLIAYQAMQNLKGLRGRGRK